MLDFIEQKVRADGKDTESEVIHAIKLSIMGIYSENFLKLSALNGLRFMNQYMSAKQIFSIKGGNDLLPFSLAKAAEAKGVTIKLNCAVTKIKRPASDKPSTKIILTTHDDSNKPKLLEFDYVAVCTPLSALQKSNLKEQKENYIKFEPPFDKSRRETIDNINYNKSIARIYYEFKDRFWENKKTAMTITNNETIWIEDHTAHLKNQSAVLEVHASAEKGNSLKKDPKAHETAKTELETIWNKETINKNLSSNEPITFFWNKEYYQKGSYPTLGIGQALYPLILSKKLPGLSFAGEFTSVFYPASMNGAIQSAFRASNEIIESINLIKSKKMQIARPS